MSTINKTKCTPSAKTGPKNRPGRLLALIPKERINAFLKVDGSLAVYNGLSQPVKTRLYIVMKDGLGARPLEKLEPLGSLADNPSVNVYLRSVIGDLD